MLNNQEKLTIALVGAGGKMGSRITNNLVKHDYNLLFCENGEKGIAVLKEKGLNCTPLEEALSIADVVIMALPDAKIGALSKTIVPLMREDTTIITLDPAAAFIGELCLRDDCTFVVTHPCHPALFYKQDSDEARADFFGGITAVQDIVIALHQGKEEKFEIAEKICIRMFAPVENCHRITVDQMAFLEPAASEVVAASAACIMKEALDEAIKYGVPEAAAKSFMLGHIQIPLAIVFGATSSPFSDAAKIAIAYGYEKIYREDWKKVFEPEAVREAVQKMLHPAKEK